MKKLLTMAIIGLIFLQSCDKGAPVDGNNAVVTLDKKGVGFVTEDATVNPGDSIFFSFTITSSTDMKYVSIQKNPVNQTAFLTRDTLSNANAHSYTTTMRFKADTVNGPWVYRIVAHADKGVYIGHKDIVVTVAPDYNYFTMRIFQVPDTTPKTNNTYMSATTGELFSYTTGAANSAKIDFGIYYDTTGKGTAVATDDSLFCIYALNAPSAYTSFYDISSWTKNATLMKKATSPAFNTLTSAGAIRAGAATNLASGARNRITALTTGNLLYFKTASGKSGCLQMIYLNGNTAEKSTYALVDVKIER